MGFVGIEKLSVMTVIGILPHERGRLQELLIDLKVKLDLSAAFASDRHADALSYVDLADICQQIARESTFHLVESFAYAAVKRITNQFPEVQVWIRVSKPGALANATAAYVEIEG